MAKKNVHFERGPIGWLQRYALLSYERPFALFFGIAGVFLLLGVLGGFLGFKLSEPSEEWEIKTNRHVKQKAAIEEALDIISEETDQQKYSISSDDLETFVTYKVKNNRGPLNIFTRENLETIRQVENLIVGFKNYTDLCKRNYTEGGTPETTNCDKPLSVLSNFFYYNVEKAQYGLWLPPNATTDTPDDEQPVGDISSVTNAEVEDSIEGGIQRINDDLFSNAFFLSEEYNPDAEMPKTRYSRSRFQFGLPIDFPKFEKGREKGSDAIQYNNSKTEDDDQVDEVYNEFWGDLQDELFDLLNMEAPSLLKTKYSDLGELGNLEVIFYNIELSDRELQRIVMLDFLWAGLSIVSVWVYMLIHLGSIFLSGLGIFEIFMSFPVALFFYKPIFQIEFFSEMNLLVIFILLGIGADDIFVFTDAYKQSGTVPGVDPSLQGRLMYSAARASKAVFVTSFTTMAAFFATAATTLMPMQAFGIFAALCIIFLFLINLLLMPPALVLYAGYTPILAKKMFPCCIPENKPPWCEKYCPCCTCCHVEIDESFYLPLAPPVSQHKKPSQAATGPDNLNYATVGSLDQNKRQTELQMTESGTNIVGSSANTSTQGVIGGREGPPVVFKRQGSLVEAEIEDLRSVEKFFYGPFYLFIDQAKYIIILIAIVLSSLGIYYVTSFKTPDEAEQWFPSYHAYDKFQEYFDGASTPFKNSAEDAVAEVYLVWGLEGMDTSNRNIWKGGDFGKLVFDDTFRPGLESTQQFLLGVCPQVRRTTCSASACEGGYLIRLNREDDASQLLDSQQICWIEDFRDWVEAQGDTFPVPENLFEARIAEYLQDPAKSAEFGEEIGYSTKKDKTKFLMFKFDSTFRPPASDSKTKSVINAWEDFIDMVNANATDQGLDGINKGFESGRAAWVWPSTSDALVSGAISGLILVFVLAFVVLNIASGNLIISSIAVITIAGIVVVVMGIGIRGIMDWDLGTAESITVVIVIGFSMDYTLHLSDAYMESPHSNRKDRTRDALTHLGISITAGALTTLISALWLWATVLLFFQKFAFNVTVTVITSFLYSIFVFPALCLIFGPSGDYGSWPRMINSVYTRYKIKPPCGGGGGVEAEAEADAVHH